VPLSLSAVALLIVNYKTYDDLDEALVSIVATMRSDDEIVVCDQLSDVTRLSSLASKFRRVRWIVREDNLGFAAGVNCAAAASSAPYLLLVNPDARLTPGAIDALAAWLDEHPSVGIVGPRVVNLDGSVQASARRFPSISTALAGRSTWLTQRFPNNWLTRRNLLARSAADPTTVDWVAGSCLMTRRDLFERLGGLDEGFFVYWEDADYARRARGAGFTTTHLPMVSVSHAGGRGAAHDPALSIRAFHRSAYRMFRKHTGIAGRLVSPIVKFGLWLRGEAAILLRRGEVNDVGRQDR
jgi:N-acetylglucosaminyl-diphospho-decaprenol L-rhamnosyltransferase